MIHKKIVLFCVGVLISLYNCDSSTIIKENAPFPPNEIWVIIQLDPLPTVGDTAILSAQVIINENEIRVSSGDSIHSQLAILDSIKFWFDLNAGLGTWSDSGFIFLEQQRNKFVTIQKGDTLSFRTKIKANNIGTWRLSAYVAFADSISLNHRENRIYEGGMRIIMEQNSSTIEQYYGTYYRHLRDNQLDREN